MTKTSTKVKLRLRCAHLPSKDLMSKSDPFAVVYLKDSSSNEWQSILTTGVKSNQEHPQWEETVTVDYKFEEMQYLKFEVYDKDSDEPDLSKQDFIGSFESNLASIMGSRGSVLTSPLFDKKGTKVNKANMTIVGREFAESNKFLEFQFKAINLKKGGLMSPNPYFKISTLQGDDRYSPVFKSEVVKSTSKPVWRKRRISMNSHFSGDLKERLKIDVFTGNDKLIGCFVANLDQLSTGAQFKLVNVKSKKDSVGMFAVESCNVVEGASFLEYIQGGCEMETLFAFDCSVIRQYEQDYLQVIEELAPVLENYDSDKNIKMYGFGAEKEEVMKKKSLDRDWFPLTFDKKTDFAHRTQGVLDAFKGSIGSFEKSGSKPVSFSKMFKSAADNCNLDGQQKYFLMVIVTAGNILDKINAIEEIINISKKPFSAMIIGVGDGDFAAMEELDNDGGAPLSLKEGKIKAERDVVQFVKLNEHRGQLAKAALEEVPEQMEEFFNSHGITPLSTTTDV